MAKARRVNLFSDLNAVTKESLDAEFDDRYSVLNNITEDNVSPIGDLDGRKVEQAGIFETKIKLTPFHSIATANLTMTTAFQAVTGTTITVTVDVPTIMIFLAVFDVQITTANGVFTGAIKDITNSTGSTTALLRYANGNGSYMSVVTASTRRYTTLFPIIKPIEEGSTQYCLVAKTASGGGTITSKNTKLAAIPFYARTMILP